MQVRVDETGHQEAARSVDRLAAPVGAEPGDGAVDDRDVELEPFAREHIEDAPTADDRVGGLFAPRNHEPLG